MHSGFVVGFVCLFFLVCFWGFGFFCFGLGFVVAFVVVGLFCGSGFQGVLFGFFCLFSVLTGYQQ